MALISYQQVDIVGTAKTYGAAAAGGDTLVPDDRGFIHVKNGSGASITVTVVVPGSQYGQARPDVAIAIAAGADKMIGPMTADLADPTDGFIDITYSAVTSVTIAAVRA